MSTRRWLAIANPAAGVAGDAVGDAPRAAEALRREGVVAEFAVTRTPGEATRLAREASASGAFDGIVALGGDGTNHEVVAGIDRARLAFASVPLGHGNCLARDLGLAGVDEARAAFARAVRDAGRESLRAIDLLDITLHDAAHGVFRHLGTCTFAAGYVAETTVTGRGPLAGLGRGAYAVASMVTRPHALDARLWLDDVELDAEEITGVVVNNTAHLANFLALPDARVDDGRLDLMGLAGGWAHQLAHNASILSGLPLAGPRLMRQGAHARIEFRAPATIMLDGEIMHGIRAAEIAVLPGALRCVAATDAVSDAAASRANVR